MRGFPAAVFTSALVGCLALSACGGDDHHRRSSADRHRGTNICAMSGCSGAEDPIARGPVTIAGAQQGGTVTVLTDHGLDGSLDPSAASDPAAVSILGGLITRSLTEYRYDPRTRMMTLIPDLATNMGQHNDDYTRWLFTIRSGSRFEDGTRITAADVVRGVRRCLHGRAFPTSPCLDNGRIHSVRVRRHNEVAFTFQRPYPDLPYLAAMPAIGPVPPGTPARYGSYARHPLASGPYEVAHYRRGRRLVLVRNPQWDTRTDPGRTQYPDRYVVLAGVPDRRIERVLLADQGSAQTTLTLDEVGPAPFQRSSDDAKRLVLGGKPCTTYLSPDNRTITDPLVRRALIWAYPYRAALRAGGLVPGVTAVPATNLVPPGVPGRIALTVPHHHGFETSSRVARRMLARARALGTPLRFLYDPSDAKSIRLRNALVRSLRASGFEPQPEQAPTALLGGDTPASLPVDLRTTTRCGDWPSGAQWLEPAYSSGHSARTGNLFFNTEAFSHPLVERRMDAVMHLPLDQQFSAWAKLDRAVLRRWQPVVPLWYGGVSMAHGSRIRGMADDSLLGMPTWGRIWVAPAS